MESDRKSVDGVQELAGNPKQLYYNMEIWWDRPRDWEDKPESDNTIGICTKGEYICNQVYQQYLQKGHVRSHAKSRDMAGAVATEATTPT